MTTRPRSKKLLFVKGREALRNLQVILLSKLTLKSYRNKQELLAFVIVQATSAVQSTSL